MADGNFQAANALKSTLRLFYDPDTGVWSNNFGSLLNRGELGVEAFDADEVFIGMFADEDLACNAILDRWESGSNGGSPGKTNRRGQSGPTPLISEAGIAGEPTPRPTALKPCLESIPHELKKISNWLLWKYEPPKKPNGKWRKVPYQVNGYKADTTNRHTWSPFETCCSVYERGDYDGIGFVFDGEVGPDGTCLVGIDLDRCIDNRKIQHFALERIKRLDTYTETSPSGTGLHLIARTEPVASVKTKEVEIYTTARYFAFTGRKWGEESPIRIATAEVRALIVELKAKPTETQPKPSALAGIKVADAFKDLPVTPIDGLTDYWYDQLTPEQKDEVVDHALKTIASKTALFEIEEDGGNNNQWYRLTTAVARSGAPNAPDIFIKYASAAKNADPEDALREHFARCQKDPPPGCRGITIGTLLKLAMEHGADFEPWRRLQHDSPAALERRARQIAENIKIGDDVTEPLLPQIMTLNEMERRLVFVGSIGVVADTITGRVRKKEHAADEYAASQHHIIQKNAAGKETLKIGPALKFWLASKARTTVEVLAWVPGAPQICQPPEGQGPAFNTWRELSPMAYPENWQRRVEPFLEHIEFLVPIAEERERFLQWLAHIVQVPEVLPHTSYLMTTPVTGIGRNLLASILVRALRGFVAAGVSLPELLDKGYTGRLSQKLLVIVDEAREGRGERRYERAERFKQIQTEEHRHVNHKYGHQIVEKNCGRWLAFSNHWDAIPFDNTDRRDIVIANPTIRKEDAYYERLYALLRDKNFIGSVRHWLESKDITAFRPGEHAPMNPAKLQAIDEMTSETERAVDEFKEDCETELTSRDAIKDYVRHTISNEGRNPYANVNDAHLTFAIRRAGMMNTGRRIVAYKKGTGMTGLISDSRFSESRFTVVIVRGGWNTEMVKMANPEKLLAAMGLKDWSATKRQR